MPDPQLTRRGEYRVIKRDGTTVLYDAEKILNAINEAFVAVEGANKAASVARRGIMATIAKSVDELFRRGRPSGGVLHTEDIQNQVELALMRAGEQSIAHAYVIYRNKRAQERLQYGGHVKKLSRVPKFPAGLHRKLGDSWEKVKEAKRSAIHSCETLSDSLNFLMKREEVRKHFMNNALDYITASWSAAHTTYAATHEYPEIQKAAQAVKDEADKAAAVVAEKMGGPTLKKPVIESLWNAMLVVGGTQIERLHAMVAYEFALANASINDYDAVFAALNELNDAMEGLAEVSKWRRRKIDREREHLRSVGFSE